MGWTDSYLHRFFIHGKDYGIAQIGGMWFSDDPKEVKLSDFGWRSRERFRLNLEIYEQIILLTVCGLVRLRIGSLILPN
ncbi:hypothetical protein NIES22_72040 (plasmid) [Calothrix brevissima NIES-22]|nr:hypothetical protein NIES22_72040 [Calothrix brevissima NIES-22]